MTNDAKGGAEMSPTKDRFGWIEFYEAVADKLLEYRSKEGRKALLQGFEKIADAGIGLPPFMDRDRKGGEQIPLQDICPFTAMGIFNRWMKEEKRKSIAAAFAEFLGVGIDVPKLLEVGIPTLHPQNAWFYPYKFRREADHIDALWNVFDAAIKFADSGRHREEFARAYDAIVNRLFVKKKLSSGLYWARPRAFPSLDGSTIAYMQKNLGLEISKEHPNSEQYLQLIDDLNDRFQEGDSPVTSFPELGALGWNTWRSHLKAPKTPLAPTAPKTVSRPTESMPYAVSNIRKEGCFLSEDEIDRHLKRLSEKKNLILQGPPGTGKTWLAKRLAFALSGRRDESKVRTVQFHPNLSYEDFVRGWRPGKDERLEIVDGPFMEAIHAALGDPGSMFTVVIEEINRGNPAQVFGEMLTLLETDKREESEALELIYPDKSGNRRAYIPPNLHVIGTMNIADRSLALMDFAFRRRFAFVTLEPKMEDSWRNWIVDGCGIDSELARSIGERINSLNDVISEDLGSHFKIGHSFVTPTRFIGAEATRDWFYEVVETEIAPLLEEYWFASPGKAQEERSRLLEGW